MECETLDRNRLLLHLMITSYVADIPECEDLLSVKRCTRSSAPCYSCLIRKEDFHTNKYVKSRGLGESMKLLSDCRSEWTIAQQKIAELSILKIPPILQDFPLVRVHESVDVYALFRFEPTHCLSLGLSKLLNECHYNYSSDSNRSSTSVTFSSGKPKHFPMIKKLFSESLITFCKILSNGLLKHTLELTSRRRHVAKNVAGIFWKMEF